MSEKETDEPRTEVVITGEAAIRLFHKMLDDPEKYNPLWKEQRKLWKEALEAFPNPEEPTEELIKRTVTALMASGNANQIYDPIDNEIYYVRPDWVRPKVGKDGRCYGYRVTNNAISYDADVDEMIHFRLTNPTGDYVGMPPSQVIKDTVLMKLSLNRYLKKYFINDALPGSTLTTEQTLTPEQRAWAGADLQAASRACAGGLDFRNILARAAEKLA